MGEHSCDARRLPTVLPVPLFHVAGAHEGPSVGEPVKSRISIGCCLKEAWQGTWHAIEPQHEDQQQGKEEEEEEEEEEVKKAILQQHLKQQLINSRMASSSRIKSGSWSFLSSSVEPSRHQLPPGDEDVQAMRGTSDSALQDRRTEADTGRSNVMQVSSSGSSAGIKTMPREFRKRIIGDIKKQINMMNSQHANCEENT